MCSSSVWHLMTKVSPSHTHTFPRTYSQKTPFLFLKQSENLTFTGIVKVLDRRQARIYTVRWHALFSASPLSFSLFVSSNGWSLDGCCSEGETHPFCLSHQPSDPPPLLTMCSSHSPLIGGWVEVTSSLYLFWLYHPSPPLPSLLSTSFCFCLSHNGEVHF